MAYSTTAELRANLPKVTTAVASDVVVADRISVADKEIKTDLSIYIDFTNVPALSSNANFPSWLNLLAQYKTCELTLIYVFGPVREGDKNGDIEYWQKKYKGIMDQIKNGTLQLYLADGTTAIGKAVTDFTNKAKKSVEPAFGVGDYGEFMDKDDLADERPE